MIGPAFLQISLVRRPRSASHPSRSWAALARALFVPAILFPAAVHSQTGESSRGGAGDTPRRAAARTTPKLPFQVGESLTYAVTYAFLEAGTLRLAVEGVEDIRGRPAYRLAFKAETNPSVSALYSLKDNLQSWIDAERLHSLRYVKQSVEKGKRRDKSYRLDQTRHVRVNEESGEEEPMPPDAQDDVSILYYLRTLPLKEGKRFTLSNLMDPDDNPMSVTVLGSEKIRVPAGTFDCFVLDLDVQTDSGVFSQGGELRVWLTKDPRHILVKLESKLALGSFTAALTDQQTVAGTLAAGALPAAR